MPRLILDRRARRPNAGRRYPGRAAETYGGRRSCIARCESLEKRQLLTTVLLEEDFEVWFPDVFTWQLNPEPSHTVLGWEDVLSAEGTGAPVGVGERIGYASSFHNTNHLTELGGMPSRSYANDMDARMLSPVIDLTAFKTAHLSFNYWLNTEHDHDFLTVTVNGTEVWQESGWTSGWWSADLDLSAFCGQLASVEFKFSSNDSVIGAVGHREDPYQGVFVDQILLTAEQPDLYSAGPAFMSDFLVTYGEPWTASWGLYNAGPCDSGPLGVDFYLSEDDVFTPEDYYLGQARVDNVAGPRTEFPPMAYAMLSIDFPTAIPAGEYHIVVNIDSGNEVAESDETNNIEVLPYTIGVVGPDLTAAAESGTFSPSPAVPGRPWSGHFDIQNMGPNFFDANAGSFEVYYYASTDSEITWSDYWMGTVPVAGLGGGETIEPVLNLASFPNLPAGDYYFGAIIDARSNVLETDERNNIICSTAGPLTVPQNILSISDAWGLEVDSGTLSLYFTVSLSNPSPSDVTFKYTTANGSALAGIDFSAVSMKTVTLLAGETAKMVPVSIRADTVVERDETFYVGLSSAVGAIIGDGVGLGTIYDNDKAAFAMSDIFYTISEGIAGARIGIKRTGYGSGTNALPVSVQYTTVDGTARAGSDYTGVSGTLNFTGAQSVQYILVPILNNAIAEGNEQFTVRLLNPSCEIPDRAVLGTPASSPVNIRDDDTPAAGRILDNRDCGGVSISGAWTATTAKTIYFASNYLEDGNAGKGSKQVTFVPACAAGTYHVYLWYPGDASHSTSTPVDIIHAYNPVRDTDTTNGLIHQELGDGWVDLGTMAFDGSGDAVRIRNAGTTATVVADAARFVPVTNARPVINRFGANPNPLVAGGSTLLSVVAQDPDGPLAGVAFYVESNGVAGWQSGARGDRRLSVDLASPYESAVSLSGWLPGEYMFYALATDMQGYSSAVAKLLVAVTAPAGAEAAPPVQAAELAASRATLFSDEKIESEDVLGSAEENVIV